MTLILPLRTTSGRLPLTAVSKKRRNPKDSQKPTSAQTLLKAVPHQNVAMEVTRRRNGSILAALPLRRPRYLVPPISWIMPYSSHRRVELDRLGTSVLEMCDGRRCVESIIEEFAADHKLSFREAQLSVTQFLRQLSQRGLVAIVGRNEDPNGK